MTSSVIAENPYFLMWVAQKYSFTLAMGIRRMDDEDPKAASLFNLLTKLARSPEKITRDWFSSNVYEVRRDSMDEAFTRDWDPSHTGHLDPVVVNADLARLKGAASSIRHYVNQYVAHAQTKPNARVPTFADLDASLDVLCELLVKYQGLLTRSGRVQVEPVFQFPWQRVFERPWSEGPSV